MVSVAGLAGPKIVAYLPSISLPTFAVHDEPVQLATVVNVSVVGPTSNSQPVVVSTTTLAFVGDIMLDRGVKQSVVKNGTGDYNYAFADLDKLKDADILIGNLEGPISDKGRDTGKAYSFRFSPAVIPVLEKQGFDVLSIANNHAGDWGISAFADMLTEFKSSSIQLVGGGNSFVDTDQPKVVEKNGVRFGFLSFSDVGPGWLKVGTTTAGISIANNSRTPEIIRQAAAACDVLSVSFHFGNEYEKNPNWRQRQLAQMAIDNGAKIVVGTHPHVAQSVEEYKGGVIMFSLGNFIFDQNFSTSTMNGLAVKIHLSGKEIESVEKLNTHIDSKYRVSVE